MSLGIISEMGNLIDDLHERTAMRIYMKSQQWRVSGRFLDERDEQFYDC